jgi:hypothetical protein
MHDRQPKMLQLETLRMPQTPWIRIASVAVAATVTIMFFVLFYLIPLLRSYGTTAAAVGYFATLLGGASIYRQISTYVWKFFQSSLTLRKFLLGPAFIEGTWVGHYVRYGRSIFTVEHHYQASDQIEITGREIDITGKPLSSWKSYVAALDAKGATLTYAYDCDIFARQGSHLGIARFDLHRQNATGWKAWTPFGNATSQPPYKLTGFSLDTTDGEKDVNMEYKVSDGPLDDQEALDRAKEYFRTDLRLPVT